MCSDLKVLSLDPIKEALNAPQLSSVDISFSSVFRGNEQVWSLRNTFFCPSFKSLNSQNQPKSDIIFGSIGAIKYTIYSRIGKKLLPAAGICSKKEIGKSEMELGERRGGYSMAAS